MSSNMQFQTFLRFLLTYLYQCGDPRHGAVLSLQIICSTRNISLGLGSFSMLFRAVLDYSGRESIGKWIILTVFLAFHFCRQLIAPAHCWGDDEVGSVQMVDTFILMTEDQPGKNVLHISKRNGMSHSNAWTLPEWTLWMQNEAKSHLVAVLI